MRLDSSGRSIDREFTRSVAAPWTGKESLYEPSRTDGLDVAPRGSAALTNLAVGGAGHCVNEEP